MAQELYQLKANAAAIYEEQKSKAIFGPLALATIDTVSISEADTVLDVACGTGIMARSVRERLGPLVRISGADLNEGMIDTAKALCRHVSNEIGEQSLAPFAYDGSERLPRILKKAGFGDVSIQSITVDRVVEAPEMSIAKEIMANPVGPTVKLAGRAVMETIVAEIIEKCEQYRRGESLVIP